MFLRDALPETRMGILGFCMGGVIALRRCSGYSDLFRAAAVWYGAITIDPALVDIPLVASYGGADTHIPVETFRAALRVPNDVVVYPNAGHGFFHHGLDTYDPAAAEDSWRRAIDFLQRQI